MKSLILKRILLGLIILLGLAVIGAIIVTKTYGFRYSDKQYSRMLSQKGAEVSIQYDTIAGQSLRSIHVGKEAETTIVFLHGSPGSSRDFERYLGDSSLFLRANLLAIDRPGYGYSGYGSVISDIPQQANLLAKLIPDSSIVVGYSYGGPVAAALAMCCPEKVGQLLLLAPALDPHNEKQFAFNNWIKRPPLKWLTSPAIQAALVEKLNHEDDLMVLMNDWDKITCPVTIMHGQDDWIVPDVNVEFLSINLSNAPITVINPDDMSHSLTWTNYDAVRSEIIDMLE